MTPSDVAAWWGAGVASLVLAWDIFKWQRTGPRLGVSLSPNMQSVRNGKPDPEKHIFIEVVNNGDKLTTLTCVEVYFFSSWWHKFRRRTYKAGVYPMPGHVQNLPHELEPGKRWTGFVDQAEIKAMYENGSAYIAIWHSGKSRPVLRRIPIERCS